MWTVWGWRCHRPRERENPGAQPDAEAKEWLVHLTGDIGVGGGQSYLLPVCEFSKFMGDRAAAGRRPWALNGVSKAQHAHQIEFYKMHRTGAPEWLSL